MQFWYARTQTAPLLLVRIDRRNPEFRCILRSGMLAGLDDRHLLGRAGARDREDENADR